jgi:hypothetical protein
MYMFFISLRYSRFSIFDFSAIWQTGSFPRFSLEIYKIFSIPSFTLSIFYSDTSKIWTVICGFIAQKICDPRQWDSFVIWLAGLGVLVIVSIVILVRYGFLYFLFYFSFFCFITNGRVVLSFFSFFCFILFLYFLFFFFLFHPLFYSLNPAQHTLKSFCGRRRERAEYFILLSN